MEPKTMHVLRLLSQVILGTLALAGMTIGYATWLQVTASMETLKFIVESVVLIGTGFGIVYVTRNDVRTVTKTTIPAIQASIQRLDEKFDRLSIRIARAITSHEELEKRVSKLDGI